jgi:hypothetical protein
MSFLSIYCPSDSQVPSRWKILALSTALALSPNFAQANVIGDYLPESENPPETCLVVSHLKKTDPATGKLDGYTATCSSTLVGEEHAWVITAAHCFDESFLGGKIDWTKITCSGKTYETEKPVVQPSYAGLQGLKLTGLVQDDLALVHLKNPDAGLRAMKISTTLAEAKNLLASETCRISGYGVGNDKNTGIQHTALAPLNYGLEYSAQSPTGELGLAVQPPDQSSHDIVVVAFGSEVNEILEEYKVPLLVDAHAKNVVAHGDSGGTLMCKSPAAKEWTLIGVVGAASADGTGFQVTLINSSANQSWLFEQEALNKGE